MSSCQTLALALASSSSSSVAFVLIVSTGTGYGWGRMGTIQLMGGAAYPGGVQRWSSKIGGCGWCAFIKKYSP